MSEDDDLPPIGTVVHWVDGPDPGDYPRCFAALVFNQADVTVFDDDGDGDVWIRRVSALYHGTEKALSWHHIDERLYNTSGLHSPLSQHHNINLSLYYKNKNKEEEDV